MLTPAAMFCIEGNGLRTVAFYRSCVGNGENPYESFENPHRSARCGRLLDNPIDIRIPILTRTKIQLRSLPGNSFSHIHILPTKMLPLRNNSFPTLQEYNQTLVHENIDSFSLSNCENQIHTGTLQTEFTRFATPLEEIVLGRLVERGISKGITVNTIRPPSLVKISELDGQIGLFSLIHVKSCGINQGHETFDFQRIQDEIVRNNFSVPFNLLTNQMGDGGETSGAGALVVKIFGDPKKLKQLGERLSVNAPPESTVDEARKLMKNTGECRERR